MKEVQQQSDVEFVNQELSRGVDSAKREASDITQKASKNLDALDRLLQKTETAQMSMEHQNKQMKSYLRK